MAVGGLYQNLPDAAGRAIQAQAGAAATTANMMRQQSQTTEGPDKTVGGGISGIAGGALAGAQLGAMTATPFGIAAGAIGGGIVGLASYLF